MTLPPLDVTFALEIVTLIVSAATTFALVRHRVSSLSAEVADLEKALSSAKRSAEAVDERRTQTLVALGNRLDAVRDRVTIVERDLSHQDQTVARIEAAITASSARLEMQISQLHTRLDEILRDRP